MLFKKKTTEPCLTNEAISEEVEMAKANEVKNDLTLNVEPKRKEKSTHLYEIGYKVKLVGADNKVKTITKKITTVAISDFEAVRLFAIGYSYERGEVIYVKKLSIKDLRK